MLSYAHVFSKNLWLMINPDVLSYDWQMGSVPLVQSILDVRNILSLTVVIVSTTTIMRLYSSYSVTSNVFLLE